MTNEEIVLQIKQGNDLQDNYLLLFSQNEGIISSLCKKYVSFAEFEDIKQEAFLTLYECVEKYDISKDVKFMSFYPITFKSHMNEYLTRNGHIHIPLGLRYKTHKYQKLVNDYFSEYGKDISDEECCSILGISLKELSKLKDMSIFLNVDSIDKVISEADDSISLADTIPSNEEPYNDVIEKIYHTQLRELLQKALANLDKSSSSIIEKYYFDNLNYTEIAKELNVTSETIRNKIKSALNDIKKGKYQNNLRHFLYLEEKTIAKAYKGGYGTFKSRGSSTEQCAIELYENEKQYAFLETIKDTTLLFSIINNYNILKKNNPVLNQYGNIDRQITMIEQRINSLNQKAM